MLRRESLRRDEGEREADRDDDRDIAALREELKRGVNIFVNEDCRLFNNLSLRCRFELAAKKEQLTFRPCPLLLALGCPACLALVGWLCLRSSTKCLSAKYEKFN